MTKQLKGNGGPLVRANSRDDEARVKRKSM